MEHELLDAEQLTARWPQFRLDGDELGLYQRDTAVVDAGAAVDTHQDLARAAGAELLEHTPVRAARGVEVHTDDGMHLTDRLVVAAGA